MNMRFCVATYKTSKCACEVLSGNLVNIAWIPGLADPDGTHAVPSGVGSGAESLAMMSK
jgi:hypothetical protein